MMKSKKERGMTWSFVDLATKMMIGINAADKSTERITI
jgi:hypothetical protein